MMTVEIAKDAARRGAILLGSSVVTSASVLVAQPDTRTALIWMGFVPILWALTSPVLQSERRVKTIRRVVRPLDRPPEPLPTLEPFESARALPPTPSAPAPPLSDLTVPVSRFPGDLRELLMAPDREQEPAGEKPQEHTSTRRYYRLRRLTEQFLREVRRMNMVAAWGREGSIPRSQAMDEIRQIEARMQGIAIRMKRAAGRPDA